jgi:hypothetical protein
MDTISMSEQHHEAYILPITTQLPMHSHMDSVCILFISEIPYSLYRTIGLYPSSGVQKKETEEHYVSETVSISVRRYMGKDKTYTQSVGSVRRLESGKRTP